MNLKEGKKKEENRCVYCNRVIPQGLACCKPCGHKEDVALGKVEDLHSWGALDGYGDAR